jgi:tetratricopeptide (TPR) repeat protein
MKYLFSALTAGLTLLGGCAAVEPATDAMVPIAGEAAAASVREPAPALPSALTADLLYDLLVAEFAGQRGALKLSAHTFLRAARETRSAGVARRAVQVAVYSREFDTALEAARLWTALAPTDSEAHESLGALQLRAGQVDAAVATFETVLQLAGEASGEAFGHLTAVLSRERDPKQALAVMRRLAEPRGNDLVAIYALSHLESALGEHEAALGSLDRLLKADPRHVQGLLLRANVQHKLGRKTEAAASVAAALALKPDDADLRLTYARMLVDARDFEAARKQFRALEQKLPGNGDIIYALGVLALEAEDTREAERHFRRLLDNPERSGEAAYALGQLAETTGDLAGARRWYESVADGATFLDARLRTAQLISRAEGVDAARSYLAGLELGTPEQRLRRYMAEGTLLRDAGRYQDAIELYSDALAVFIDNTDLLYARAMAAERIDRIDVLEEDLLSVLAKDPDNVQALNALGYTLADRTDRIAEARDYVQRAFEKSPNDPSIIDSMGWVLYRLGEHEVAIRHLRRALELLQDGEIAAHLGEVLWVSGNQEEARRVWTQALEFAPDHEVLQRAIERFGK